MKPIININNITKFFGDKLLFENIDFRFTEGRYAIIGANGSGKSTLLECILDSEKCSYGSTSINGLYIKINQELDSKYYTFTVGEYFRQLLDQEDERKIGTILDELELNINESDYISYLSGGQKRKLELAKLLVKNRDIVMMDEPTNHLDIDIRAWLMDWINSYKGLLLCVTHDRDFINNCFDQVVELIDHKLVKYTGDYENYLDTKEYNNEVQAKAHDLYMRKKAKEDKLIATIRQRASIYDSPKRGKLLKSRQKFMERFIAKNEVDKPKKEKQMSIKIAGGTYDEKRLLQIKGLDVKIYGKTLISHLIYTIKGNTRLLIVGPNGSGKSSLLNYITSVLSGQMDDPKVIGANGLSRGYFDQNNIGVAGDKTVLDRVETKLQIKEELAKNKLNNIGITSKQLKTLVKDLSYGQKVKLKFLQLMNHKIDLLIMDEPTNHLDIGTIEALEKMLDDYKGAVILVCHDIYFVDKLGIDDILRIG